MYFKKILIALLISNTKSFNFNRRTFVNSVLATKPIEMYIQNESLEKKENGLYIPEKKILNSEQEGNLGIIQEDNNDIYFYGPVSQRSCFELKNRLNILNTKSHMISQQFHIDPPPIHLHIQSEGGSLYHTLYIIDLIQNINTPVYTYIDGFAASAATLMSVVGDKRFMTKNSLMLIHQLSGADSGKFNELKDQMTNMEVLMNIITDTYLNNTKLDVNTLKTLLAKDLWLDSDKCLKYGLVDDIL